jgi:hypothetical protein
MLKAQPEVEPTGKFRDSLIQMLLDQNSAMPSLVQLVQESLEPIPRGSNNFSAPPGVQWYKTKMFVNGSWRAVRDSDTAVVLINAERCHAGRYR